MDEILKNAKNFGEIFNIVKECVQESLGMSRAGLMLALSHLGLSPSGFVGAYHQVASNVIVLNQNLVKKIEKESPENFNYYVFHLLLHEYIHSLGFLDEVTTRLITESISEKIFGAGHMLARIAKKFDLFIPNIKYSSEPNQNDVTIVNDFEINESNYIG